eukprot:6352320-Pyramimonas_sp.AAC.1
MHPAPIGYMESGNTMESNATMLGDAEDSNTDWGKLINAAQDEEAHMEQLQSLLTCARIEATSSDDEAHCQSNGQLDIAVRSLVDAWSSEAILWPVESAR